MYTEENIQIGKRLRAAREYADLTAGEVASTLDISVDHYRKIERGMYPLGLDKLNTLCKYHGFDSLYLLTGKGKSAIPYYTTMKKAPESMIVMQELCYYCQEYMDEEKDD